MGIRENFAANLARILREKKVSQAVLAEKVGLTQSSISGWITLRDWPAPENVDKVLDFLGVNPGDLFAEPKGQLAKPKPEDELLDAFRIAVKKGRFKVTKEN